ncbi:hypothetical protein GH714_030479 [Hevea brasiliensis]|uniref:Uncharacterized protein n=1 Tax=Hevea brasiliensis TaxID=3981 RepID=A0A6A6KD81_HEVBR|nr:hypothetical protein GH714_030479 [Hevea brasiliensis]
MDPDPAAGVNVSEDLSDSEGSSSDDGRQPQFKFLEAWLLDNSFGAVVDLAWTSSSSMKDCTTSFTRAAYTWNQDMFRCIRRKKERFLRPISGVERALSVHLTSVYLTNIERSLKDEFNTNLA